jgi:membrane protease YdiL (CAAX protease family)
MVPDNSKARDGVAAYSFLACLITWTCAAPVAIAWMRHELPPSYAIAGAGLSAFGPLIAAAWIAGRRGELRQVFGRWRSAPGWIVLGLVAPLATHLLAGALSAATGAPPAHWFHPPLTPEHIAALVVFPIGEEFGWRGFAQPRMVARYGAVVGSLLVGLVWGVWHLGYMITPERASFDPFLLAITLIKLPLWSLVIGWAFERADRSMAVALAFHAGGHLDNLQRDGDVRLHALHIVVLAIAALFAGRELRRSFSDRRVGET